MQTRRHRRAQCHALNKLSLGRSWASTNNRFDHGGPVFNERFFVELKFSHRHRHVAVLIELKFYATRFHFADRLRSVVRHGAGFRIRH